MSFTISSAKTLAESWFEETLDDALILIWGNEFLQRIVSNKLWLKKTQVFENVEANTPTAIAAGFVRSIKVEDSNDVEYSGYQIKNGNISFNVADTYGLTYVEYPDKLADITKAFPLPDAFEYPLAEFLIFKYYNFELDDEDSKQASEEYEQRFTYSLKKLYGELEIDSESDSFQVTMRW